MGKNKTIRMWLHRLPKDVHEKALYNINNHNQGFWGNPAVLKKKCSSLSDAIGNSFPWSETKEGGDYWVQIHDGILAQERAERNAETRVFTIPDYMTGYGLYEPTISYTSAGTCTTGIINHITLSSCTYTYDTDSGSIWRVSNDAGTIMNF
jgi:hypothetical protein